MTVKQIAEMAGADRSTVQRWLDHMEGPVGVKYREARRKGLRIMFAPEEAEQVIQAGAGG